MAHLDKPNAQEPFLAKQREFVDALSSLLSEKFHNTWIPVFAKTCYREIQKVDEEKKAGLLRQVLVARSDWIQDLRIKALHDLARYVQANQSEFDGDAQHWMQERLTEIWSETSTEEVFRDWFAGACDDTDDLESWRAPSWLPAALELSTMKVRLQENSDSEDTARLDLKSTDELLSRFFLGETFKRLTNFSILEQQKIAELQVFISQGAKIPLGLHTNEEESLLSATHRQLISVFRSAKGTKASGRRRRRLPVYYKRENKIREFIRKNPKVKGLTYCQRLDFENIKTPPIWREQGCPESYKEAYLMEHARWRHYIHTEKSRLRPKTEKSQTGKSKK